MSSCYLHAPGEHSAVEVALPTAPCCCGRCRAPCCRVGFKDWGSMDVGPDLLNCGVCPRWVGNEGQPGCRWPNYLPCCLLSMLCFLCQACLRRQACCGVVACSTVHHCPLYCCFVLQAAAGHFAAAVSGRRRAAAFNYNRWKAAGVSMGAPRCRSDRRSSRSAPARTVASEERGSRWYKALRVGVRHLWRRAGSADGPSASVGGGLLGIMTIASIGRKVW